MISFLRNFLEPFSYLIYAVTLFLEIRMHSSFGKKVLFFYYVIATLIITYACVIALDYDDNNNWIYNIHYFLSAGVFAYYFDAILVARKEKMFVRYLLVTTIIILLITDVISYPFFNSAGNAFFFLLIVICSFLYFNQLLVQRNEENILLNFNFWLVSGFVIYFLGSFFIILTYNYFTDKVTEEQKVLLGDLWSIQNILLLISSAITLFGHLWIIYQKRLH